jgi:hypothetical protein
MLWGNVVVLKSKGKKPLSGLLSKDVPGLIVCAVCPVVLAETVLAELFIMQAPTISVAVNTNAIIFFVIIIDPLHYT